MVGRPRYRLRTPSTGREIVDRGRARHGLHRSRDRRGARGGRHRPAAAALRVAPAVGRREPPLLHLVRPARAARSQRLPHLRAAHGAARVLERLYPLCHMRTYVVVLFAVACLGLSACGSDSASHDVVPASLPALTPAPGAGGARPDLDGHLEHVRARHHLDRPDGHDVHRPDPDPEPGAAERHHDPGAAPGTRASATGGTSTGGTGGSRGTLGRHRHGHRQRWDRRRVAGRVQPVLQGQPGRLLVGLGGERVDYEGLHLARPDVGPDPIEQVRVWLAAAREAGIYEPEAMTLATVDADGRPRARYVLLRGLDERGFCFFTNYRSAKARELEAHPHAALTFGWLQVHRSVRVEGTAERLPERRERRLLRRRARARRASARGRRRRARSSPRARSSSARSRPSSSASRAPRSRAPRTGAASSCAPSASSCGRGAPGACTIACATSAPATAGASSASRRRRRLGLRARPRGPAR